MGDYGNLELFRISLAQMTKFSQQRKDPNIFINLLFYGLQCKGNRNKHEKKSKKNLGTKFPLLDVPN